MSAKKPFDKTKRRESKPIPEKSVKKMLKTAKTLRDRLVISLLVNTGQRRVDIVKIKLKDLDLVGQTITVIQQKTKEMAYLPLPDDLVSDLNIYINEHLNKKETWLFPGRMKGMHLSVWSINKIVNKIVKASGVCHATPHDFRATYLTRAGKFGISPKMIIDTFGISFETVMKHYQKFTPEETQEALSRVHIT